MGVCSALKIAKATKALSGDSADSVLRSRKAQKVNRPIRSAVVEKMASVMA